MNLQDEEGQRRHQRRPAPGTKKKLPVRTEEELVPKEHAVIIILDAETMRISGQRRS